MALYVTEFAVSGNGQFPIDMLWYDTCFPRTQEDVTEITNTLGPAYRVTHRNTKPITLGHYGDSSKWVPTKERWSSFLWQVDTRSIRIRKLV